MSEKRHPGITMHKLSFSGGLPGLVFTIGSALIFLFGLPALWYFVAFAFALGLGIAMLLRMNSSLLSDRNKPLSIAPSETRETSANATRDKKRQLFQIYPLLSTSQ